MNPYSDWVYVALGKSCYEGYCEIYCENMGVGFLSEPGFTGLEGFAGSSNQ